MNARFFSAQIAYLGSYYCGWQRQAETQSTPSVQKIFETALEKVVQKKTSVTASGRTDAGVHARRQTVHFRASTLLSAETLQKAINTYLPKDIRIIVLQACDNNFHAQKSAKAKTYRYFILHSPQNHSSLSWPFLQKFTWFVPGKLNIPAMQKALTYLEGVHDFRSFQNSGTKLKNTVREIFSAQLLVHENKTDFAWLPPQELNMQILEVRIRGSGFLKQMVRAIVGTIVEIGREKRTATEMQSILQNKNRALSGITAPPYGLFLDNVEY